MNETELLAMYRDNASLRKQLADAEIREMELKSRIEQVLNYIYRQGDISLTQGQVDEIICRLNGE
jgi:hypothetical protein